MNKNIPLGKSTTYKDQYDKNLLFRIARESSRTSLGIDQILPFDGYDLWNCYELSWLDAQGKPHVAIAKITCPATSLYIVESKSLKLYLNSFNNSSFSSPKEVQNLIIKDLEALLQAPCQVTLWLPDDWSKQEGGEVNGISLDQVILNKPTFSYTPEMLVTTSATKEEVIYSHLLRSLCPVTAQPDWGTVIIAYKGSAIDHTSLLSYIVSLRNHQDFHEHCCEMIFTDILNRCKPEQLAVGCFYTRRGGIDINPIRWTKGYEDKIKYHRLRRQ